MNTKPSLGTIRSLAWSIELLCLGALLGGCSLPDARVTALGVDTGVYSSPAWSPDGTMIAFQFDPKGREDPRLEYLEVDTKEIRILTPLVGQDVTHPAWMTDSIVAYSSNYLWGAFPGTNRSWVGMLDIGSGTPIAIGEGKSIYDISWGEDGTRAALVREKYTDHQIVTLMDPVDGSERTIFDPEQGYVINGIGWQPNDQVIAVALARAFDPTSETKWPVSEIALIDAVSGVSSSFYSSEKKTLYSPSWSPTGTWMVIRTVDANYHSSIAIVNTATGKEAVRLRLAFEPVDVAWSPVGDRLAITSVGIPGENMLYVVDVSGEIKNVISGDP